ncbi:unnamed protein product, partial [Urochloa humidicola]
IHTANLSLPPLSLSLLSLSVSPSSLLLNSTAAKCSRRSCHTACPRRPSPTPNAPTAALQVAPHTTTPSVLLDPQQEEALPSSPICGDRSPSEDTRRTRSWRLVARRELSIETDPGSFNNMIAEKQRMKLLPTGRKCSCSYLSVLAMGSCQLRMVLTVASRRMIAGYGTS